MDIYMHMDLGTTITHYYSMGNYVATTRNLSRSDSLTYIR